MLVKKTDAYIEFGGAGGMIFQTQLMWMLFLIGFIFCLLLPYIMMGGFSRIYHDLFREVLMPDGQWQKQFQYSDLFGVLLSTLGGFGGLQFIIYHAARATCRDLSRTLPLRFHRQRREVMFSRWNEETKQTEIRYVPWEKVCAMVGQGSAVTSAGVMSSASLMIGANNEQRHGHFWSASYIGAMDKIYAAGIWEMIRSFMEEGPDEIDEPQPLTLDGLIEQHCQSLDMTREAFFTPERRFWWLLIEF